MKKMLSKFGSIITKLQGNHKYVKWQIVSLLYTLCCKLHRYDFGIFLEGTTSPFDSLKDKYWTKQHYKIEHRLFWCLQDQTHLKIPLPRVRVLSPTFFLASLISSMDH